MNLIDLNDPSNNFQTQIDREPVAHESAELLLLSFLDQVNSLVDFKSYKDIRSFLKLLLQRARHFLGADSISVYHALSEKPSLIKLATLDRRFPFPQILPLEDILTPYQPNLWTDERAPENELQRHAHKNGFKYVISYPLGKGQEFFGLIAAAGFEPSGDGLLFQKLQLISAIIENGFQKHVFIDSLQNRLNQTSRLLESRSLVYNNTQEAVIIVDPDLRVMEINSTAEQMLGYSLKEVKKSPVADLLVGADGLMEALEVAHAGIETRELGIVSLHRRNGQAFSAHIQSFPILDANDKLREIVIMVSDESENEQNRIRVQHLEQRAALGGLSAIFAHEVRNPINNISTAVQLLKVRIAPEDPNFEVLTRIQTDYTRLSSLVDSVLAFSRPIEPRLQGVNICVHMQALLERWRPRFEHLNIHFYMKKPKTDLFVHADPRLLDQIFTNLVSNAVDVMEQTGGSLGMKITRNDQVFMQPQVEIAVSDTGRGIPDDIIEKIFDPFVSTKPKGTGLGLAITKHMVTAQHGSIRVSSFPGGSVFYVSLPEFRGE